MTAATVPAGESAPGTRSLPRARGPSRPVAVDRTTRDDGVLEVGGVALTDIAADFATPAFVMDRADLRGAPAYGHRHGRGVLGRLRHERR